MIEKIYYITTLQLGNLADDWIKANPHNNGFALAYFVEDSTNPIYPEMNQYFLDNGLEVGEEVLIHSFW